MKKIFAIVLTVFLMCIASNARAYDFTAKAPTGQTLSFFIFNGVVGVWDMEEYSADQKELVIPSTVKYHGYTYKVTSICGGFDRHNTLTSVTIPNTITKIPYGTFLYCENLNSVTLPNSITEIDDRAFKGCTSLTSITIPNSVKKIDLWGVL